MFMFVMCLDMTSKSTSIVKFVSGLKMSDIPALTKALRDHFPADRPRQTKWSEREENSRKRSLVAAFGRFTEIISGEEPMALISEYASDGSRVMFPGEYPSLMKRLVVLLNNCDPNNDEHSFFRRNILQVLLGVRSRYSLVADGVVLSKALARTIRDHIEASDLEFIERAKRGRQSISEEQKASIHDACMSDANSKKTFATCNDEVNRSMTVARKDVWRKLPEGKCSLSTFHKYTTGGKMSISVIPQKRKARGMSDMCSPCEELRKTLIKLRADVTVAAEAAPGESPIDMLNQFLSEQSQTFDQNLSRGERFELNDFFDGLCVSKEKQARIADMMSRVATLSKHKRLGAVIKKHFKAVRADPPPGVLVTNSDWKENVKRGYGPREDSSVVHNLEATAVFGQAMAYRNEQWGKTGRIYVVVVSDVVNKSQLAAMRTEEFIITELRKLEWFKPIWEKIKTLHQFYDKGKHFLANQFLGWKLLSLPRELEREIVIQIFEGGHGKTGWVDGTMFGTAVGNEVAALKKQKRLTSTQQLLECMKAKRATLASEQSKEDRDLNRWVFLQWKPTKRDIPKSLIHLKQLRVSSFRCWSSTPKRGFFGKVAVDISCHGAIYQGDKGVHWTSGVHFTAESVRVDMDDWCRARTEVVDAPNVDAKRIARTISDIHQTNVMMRDTNRGAASHMLLKQKRPRPTPDQHAVDGRCSKVAKWKVNELVQGAVGPGQKELVAECMAHGLPRWGDTKQLRQRLRGHLQSHAHPVQTSGGSQTLVRYFGQRASSSSSSSSSSSVS
jgi:hypothetical protein